MAIIQLPLPIAANTGVTPNIKTMTTTDSFTTITTAGYLNSGNLQGYPVGPQDILHIIYSYDLNTKEGTFGIFTVTVANGVITLSEDKTTNEVTYTPPSVANHIAVFSNTTGNLTDNVATAINGGNLQAGLSGTAGTLTSYPSAAASGSLKLSATANSADVQINVTNAVVSSARTYTLVDSGTTNGYIQISAHPSIACSNLFWIDANITAAQILASYTLLASPATGAQFRIREIYLNKNGTPLSGGDRNIQITDSTNIYTLIPSASCLTPTNDRWGSTAVPYPASVGVNTPTAASFAILVNVGAGGTTDYTAGTLALSVLVERIA